MRLVFLGFVAPLWISFRLCVCVSGCSFCLWAFFFVGGCLVLCVSVFRPPLRAGVFSLLVFGCFSCVLTARECFVPLVLWFQWALLSSCFAGCFGLLFWIFAFF